MGKRIIATIISCITVFMMFGCGGGEKYPPDMGFKITDIQRKRKYRKNSHGISIS